MSLRIAAILLVGLSLTFAVPRAFAEDAAPKPPAGLRIFSAGHSFHVFMPGILKELAKSGGIEAHTQVGVQSIGGSRVIQHWDLPEGKNQIKPALATGKIDVLTLSPIYLPDQGIENLVRLALEHNGETRILLQEFWLPFDVYAPNYQKERPRQVDRNARTADELRKESEPYFESIEGHVRELNKKVGKEAVFVVPVGQAAIALREKIIAGAAPGIKQQNDLFTDAIGHATAPLQALTAYCHYAVIYRRSPVGLAVPNVIKGMKGELGDETKTKLNRLLQELAWDAVSEHPLAGVKK